MDKNELAEQLKYSSSQWLYVVTWNSILKQLFCPFRVSVIDTIGELEAGQVVLVKEVKVTLDLKTVFIIDSNAYFYYHFNIIID